jgi:hypothetical protein
VNGMVSVLPALAGSGDSVATGIESVARVVSVAIGGDGLGDLMPEAILAAIGDLLAADGVGASPVVV